MIKAQGVVWVKLEYRIDADYFGFRYGLM